MHESHERKPCREVDAETHPAVTVHHAKALGGGQLPGLQITLLLCGIAATLKPDDRLGHRIPNDCEAYDALQHCDQTLGGIRQLQIIVEWSEGQNPSRKSGRQSNWRKVQSMTTKLLSAPMSVRTLLSIFPGADNPAKLNLRGLLPEAYVNQFWNEKKRTAQVAFRIQDRGMVVYGPSIEKLESRLQQIEQDHPGVRLTLTGEALVATRTVQGLWKN